MLHSMRRLTFQRQPPCSDLLTSIIKSYDHIAITIITIVKTSPLPKK